MTVNDDTQPRRPQQPIYTDTPSVDTTPYDYGYAEPNGGPGCAVWGCMGLFSAVIAIVVVVLAAFAGWTEGLKLARVDATADRDAEINVQCQGLINDITMQNITLMERRVADLALATPAPACLIQLAPTITAVYVNNLATATPTITLTPQPSSTSTAAPVTATQTALPEATEEPASNTGGFDLDGLFAEAQIQMDAGQYGDAIDTLDAISAIDPTYNKANVDSMLFRALTTMARNLYTGNGNLAEAIVLTNQAERFGDVGELNFERAVAQSYLNAQSALNVNYPTAIRNLREVIRLAPNYRDAATQLYDQLVGYGDALALGGAACDAVGQYDAAIALRSQNASSITTKRDNAQRACQGALTPEAATPVPGETAPETAPTDSGVAPIGVQN